MFHFLKSVILTEATQKELTGKVSGFVVEQWGLAPKHQIKIEGNLKNRSLI